MTDVQTSATIASLRADVERLTAELDASKREHGWVSDLVAVMTKDNNNTFDGINAALDAAGITFLDDDTYAACIGRLAKERDDRNAYAERLLAENVRLSNEAATARERAGVLEAEVRAWREAVNTLDMISEHPDHQHCISGEWDDGRKCDDCKLWSDAVRCRRETDRTNALDAAKFGGA